MRLLGGRAVVGALVVMVVLAGCAPQQEPATSAPTPSSTATEDPAPRSAQPAFGGDCQAAVGDAEISAAFGSGMTLRRSVPEAATAGGLECWWSGDAFRTVSLTIFPAEVVPSDLVSSRAAPACEETVDGWICAEGRTSGSAWVAFSAANSGQTPPAAFDDLFSIVLDRLASSPAPVAAESTDEWWSTDCDAIAQSASLATHLGVGYLPGYPGDGVRGDGRAVLNAGGYALDCQWYAPETNEFVSVTAYPGGAGAWNGVAAEHAPSSAITIPGAVEALSWSSGESGASGVIASDGVNVVRVAGVGAESVVAAVLATL